MLTTETNSLVAGDRSVSFVTGAVAGTAADAVREPNLADETSAGWKEQISIWWQELKNKISSCRKKASASVKPCQSPLVLTTCRLAWGMAKPSMIAKRTMKGTISTRSVLTMVA